MYEITEEENDKRYTPWSPPKEHSISSIEQLGMSYMSGAAYVLEAHLSSQQNQSLHQKNTNEVGALSTTIASIIEKEHYLTNEV